MLMLTCHLGNFWIQLPEKFDGIFPLPLRFVENGSEVFELSCQQTDKGGGN